MAGIQQQKAGKECLPRNSTLQNMLDATQLLINHNDPTMYVSTRAERVAMRMLNRLNCIFIKGRSGTGKSRLGLRLLSQIAKEKSHTPLVLCFSQDWKSIPTTKEKYVIMIDDIFGSSNLSVSQEEKWKRQFEIMWPSVESGNVLLVITSRPEISAQCKTRIQKYTLIEKIPSIELDEGELRLKPVEKMKFLRKYCSKTSELSQKQMEEISKIHTSLGFPQCCEFFAKNKYVQTKGMKFFEKPHEFLKDVIVRLKESDPLGYFVLQLVMLNQGSLKHELLTILHPPVEFTNLICQLNSFSYISSKPSRDQIKAKADSMCGVYLSRLDKHYQFSHQSIIDALFLDFAKECPTICIQNCPVKMLDELVRTEGQDTNEDEVVLHLEQDMHDVLADRFAEILQSRSATVIWDHPSLWNESFVHLLMSKLSTNNLRDIMSILSNTTKFSYEKHLTDHQNILLHSITEKNEILTKNLLTKLEVTQQEYNKTDVLALVILKSLSDLVMLLLGKGITPEKKCFQALCYSESLEEDVIQTVLNGLDILSFNLPQDIGTRLLAQASLNGNIFVVNMMMDSVIAGNPNNAYDCLEILFNEMVGVELQRTAAQRTDNIIRLLLSNVNEDLLDNMIQICCGHKTALALNAVLEKVVMYHYSNWRWHLESALKWGVGDHVEQLLKKVVKEDMREDLSKFLHVTAGSYIDSGPKMKLLLQQFDNTVSLVNETHGAPRTPLHIAMARGNIEVVKILVKEGVDVNIQDWMGQTLLLLAVMGDHEDLVKVLLEAGADVNLNTYGDGVTPLLIHTENKNVMKMLVQAGSDVNGVTKKGRTALFSAVRENDIEAAKVICSKGGDVNHVDRDGHSILHTACQFGDVDMIDFMCKHGVKTTLDDNGASVLHYSAESEGDAVENVQYVVDILGVPVDVEDSRGRTALFTAVKNSDMELVEYLVEKGADLKHRDKEDNSLLHAICECMLHFHLKMIKFLCDAGIDPDLCNKSKRTGLHVALSHRDTSLAPCIMFLTTRMSDVNQPDCDGTTPLHLAATTHLYVEMLLSLGAGRNINGTNHQGQTPLHLAAKSGTIVCMKLLLENGAERSINEADKSGKTPLHLACTVTAEAVGSMSHGSDHYVGLLLEKGADKSINKTDSDGRSPLHLAAECRNFQSVRFLLDKGADRNIKDKMGRIPADITSSSQIRKLLEWSKETIMFVWGNKM